ncbi:DUF998 domain-containing protein [Kitasatospora purpeofusca]|uniref:DUF998 domain-containing protein n=1 Tax=Kitasatospora purpeofusca TaxID=67352 RepID=UPI003659FCA0
MHVDEVTSVRLRRLAALLGAVGPVVFTLGWGIGQAVQDGRYDPGRDDISDLGALTARHPWVVLTGQALGGAAIVVFALVALRFLVRDSRAGRVGAWLLALSGLGLGNLLDTLFRLDCRAADGCDHAHRAASWHGTIHEIGGVTILLLAMAPLVLTMAFRHLPGWAGFALASQAVGSVQLLLLMAYLALGGHDGSGYVQRAIGLLAAAWIVTLAVRVLRRPRSMLSPSPDEASPEPVGRPAL